MALVLIRILLDTIRRVDTYSLIADLVFSDILTDDQGHGLLTHRVMTRRNIFTGENTPLC